MAISCACSLPAQVQPQSTGKPPVSSNKKVLLIFSEARDLPGNVMIDQATRSELTASTGNHVEFFSESLDSGHFPTPKHYRVFRNYIDNKFSGQHLDLAMMFMSRDFLLAGVLPPALESNLPSVFVVINDLDVPELPIGRPYAAIFQRFDVEGTIRFILQLQPETRRIIVVGGTSPADQAVIGRIAQTARSVDGIDFEYWTNRPLAEVQEDAEKLPEGTVILMGTVQRDVTGQPMYTSQIVRTLAPNASVPVYVLGNGQIGSGALGGAVIDFEDLGREAGKLASRILAGTPPANIPIELRSNGVPMVDWRELQRWHIKTSRLPANCIVRYEPRSIFENHWKLFTLIAAGFIAQAITIAALLMQRKRQKYAEAEILKQRTELAHVSRVSMVGQLASALTHELNQPLGAILRNAEAAELYLRSDEPNLAEVRAILTDIRRDDKRAGNVIDRMRSLFKRQRLTLGPLDLRDLIEDTLAMVRPDTNSRQVKLRVEIPPFLPLAQGDRVHIQQILLNLIFNGMDAMDAVPPPRRLLTVSATKTDHGNLRVVVADRGTGIAPENAEQVFEPFFTTKSDGMGMGLAISKTIIEAHGGDIWMNSSAAEGTTFTFILPPAGTDKANPGDLPTHAGDLS